jgi:prevent-host-death family protein
MRRLAVSAVRERIADVLTHVHLRRERIVLTRHGRPIGAIVPLDDLRRLEALEDDSADASPPMTAYRVSWRSVTQSIHRPRRKH